MKLLITGADGMLGQTLQRRLADHTLFTPQYPDFDITKPESVDEAFAAASPDAVIHCAAMTQVDQCETARDQAFAINGEGTRNVAQAAAACGARLIAISTDYVFDGTLDRPYREDDPTNPKSVYGQSKLAGEQAVQELSRNFVILRIAWLYGEQGPSFVHTMLKLGAQGGDPLKVVDDQVGNPTSTTAVAEVVAVLLTHPVTGIIHGTCEGETSWYGFTKEIFALKGFTRGVQPCTTAEFPRPAPRPANSRLDNHTLRSLGLPSLPHWKTALADFLNANG